MVNVKCKVHKVPLYVKKIELIAGTTIEFHSFLISNYSFLISLLGPYLQDVIPSTLQELTADIDFDSDDALPSSITHLSLHVFNRIDTWPPNLTHLQLSEVTGYSKSPCPSSLILFAYYGTVLVNWLSDIPSPFLNTLQYLIFGKEFNRKLNYLPPRLVLLQFGAFNHPLPLLPSSLTQFFLIHITGMKGVVIHPFHNLLCHLYPTNTQSMLVIVLFDISPFMEISILLHSLPLSLTLIFFIPPIYLPIFFLFLLLYLTSKSLHHDLVASC